ncbi:hypothetical protein Tco_0710580 [Tanacetum coccineum]
MDKVHMLLRVGVNRGRHKSSGNMQTTRYERLSMVREKRTVRGKVSPHVSRRLMASLNGGLIPSAFLPILFPSLFGASSNPKTLFLLSADPREPELEGRSSFPARLRPWTNLKVGISRSGSMICKWRVFRSSGGKHGSSYRKSFASGVAWVILGVMYHDLYFGGKTLIEMENMGLTFAQVSSKAHHEGVGLRVADSYTGNHPEGMRELHVVSSTTHAMMKFPTLRGIATLVPRRDAIFECRQLEDK